MVNETHLERYMHRSGITETLAREVEEQRAADFEKLRLQKKSAIDKFLSARPEAEDRKAAAADKAESARRAFDASIADLMKASAKLDQVHDAMTEARDRFDAQLRQYADPEVDVLRAELDKLRRAAPFTGSHDEKTGKVREVAELIDELERIRVGGERGTITDVRAALEELRIRIPQ